MNFWILISGIYCLYVKKTWNYIKTTQINRIEVLEIWSGKRIIRITVHIRIKMRKWTIILVGLWIKKDRLIKCNVKLSRQKKLMRKSKDFNDLSWLRMMYKKAILTGRAYFKYW